MKVKNLDGFKKEPIISVIVPVYNSESYLKDCLDSIIEQTYENLEIILIDDGSIDDSLSIIQMYAKMIRESCTTQLKIPDLDLLGIKA